MPTKEDYAKQVLLRTMEDWSEDEYCASWLSELEYSLWTATIEDTTGEYAKFKELAEDAGGWWMWDDKTFRKFVPMAEWLEIYQKWVPILEERRRWYEANKDSFDELDNGYVQLKEGRADG